MFGKRFLRSVNSTVGAVGATSTQVVSTLVSGKAYILSANTNFWFAQGGSGTTTATKTSGSVYVAAGAFADIIGSNGPAIAVLQDSAAGQISIVPVDEI